jgi:hypothetical protein
MQDPRKHHCQRGFVSRQTGLLHVARHMSLWHVDRGMSPCCLGPRSVASHRRSQRRTINSPPPGQHPRSRRITSPRPPAPHRDSMYKPNFGGNNRQSLPNSNNLTDIVYDLITGHPSEHIYGLMSTIYHPTNASKIFVDVEAMCFLLCCIVLCRGKTRFI